MASTAHAVGTHGCWEQTGMGSMWITLQERVLGQRNSPSILHPWCLVSTSADGHQEVILFLFLSQTGAWPLGWWLPLLWGDILVMSMICSLISQDPKPV